MFSLIDEIVITESNQDGFETILNITNERDAPVKAVIHGPLRSGKSTVAQARGRSRDLLSGKKVQYAHISELVSFFNLGDVGEKYLEQAGAVDALILDGIDASLIADEVATQLCKLLILSRNDQKVDTLIISDLEPSELDASELGQALEGFSKIAVEPLNAEGLITFAHKMILRYKDENAEAPSLDEGAIRYISGTFAHSAQDVRNAIRYLMTGGIFGNESIVSVNEVMHVLNN